MIVVNARFLTQPISGVQRYAIEICKELKKHFNDIVFISPKCILHEDVAKELNVITFGRLNGHLWEQVELPYYLKKNKNPLLICLANTAPILYKNKITVLHDIAFERFPRNFSWKFRYTYRFLIPRIVRSSIVMLTVSEFSRDEISDVYGVSKEKVRVVYCAVASKFVPKKNNIVKESYLLAVSSLNYQKNFHSLIQAFNKLENKTIKLYLVGAINKNFANPQLVKDIESNERIVFLGRINDDELISLYSNAECFIYPSLYEGFGIPPLEAQSCGCPCVISNAASLPEVGGDSVIYCNPYSVEDISVQIEKVINSTDLQEKLVLLGFDNVKRFSWKESSKQVVDIIKEYQ